jgi:hypothetical protein
MTELFQQELLYDERILWSGQPSPGKLFTPADIFLVPFSLLWGGFAIFWELTALNFGAPLLFKLFGIPFVCVGLYFIFGRFIFKCYLQKRTYYAVTNKRVLIITNTRNKNLTAEFIDRIPTINKKSRRDGSGTLIFGNYSPFHSMYGNSGMNSFSSHRNAMAPSFDNIEKVDHVYNLINSIRKGQPSNMGY